MRSGKPHRRRFPVWVTVLAGTVVGGALGWAGGRLWYEVFGSREYGSDLEGLQEVVRGAAAGGLWGGLAGWLVHEIRPATRRAWLLVGSVAAAILCVTGLSYTGDLTNQGPASARSRVGFAALPAGLALVYLMARARAAWRAADQS